MKISIHLRRLTLVVNLPLVITSSIEKVGKYSTLHSLSPILYSFEKNIPLKLKTIAHPTTTEVNTVVNFEKGLKKQQTKV